MVCQALCLGWSEANIALVDPWLSIRVDVVKELDHHRVRRSVRSPLVGKGQPADGSRVVLLGSASDGARGAAPREVRIHENCQVVRHAALVDGKASGQLADGEVAAPELGPDAYASGVRQSHDLRGRGCDWTTVIGLRG